MQQIATNESGQKQKWTFRDASTLILTIICLMLAVNIGLLLIDLKELFIAAAHRSVITFTLLLIQEGIFIFPLYYLIIKKYAVRARELGLRKIGAWEGAKWVLKGFALVILFNFIFAFMALRLGQGLPGFGPQQSHIPLFGGSALDVVFAVVALVIIAPVVEEIVFRGFIFQTLMAAVRPAYASLAAAAIFSLVHFEFESAGIIFVLGLILNWIFMRSKSLWPCIAFHVVNNALAFLLEWLIWTGQIKI